MNNENIFTNNGKHIYDWINWWILDVHNGNLAICGTNPKEYKKVGGYGSMQ
jgi:hypothetical protein